VHRSPLDAGCWKLVLRGTRGKTAPNERDQITSAFSLI
jgi:hypothetical protein